MVCFELPRQFVIKSQIRVCNRAWLCIDEFVPKLGKLEEVNILPVLVRRVNFGLLPEFCMVDMSLECYVFLVCVHRNHSTQSALTKLEVTVPVGGLGTEAS